MRWAVGLNAGCEATIRVAYDWGAEGPIEVKNYVQASAPMEAVSAGRTTTTRAGPLTL